MSDAPEGNGRSELAAGIGLGLLVGMLLGLSVAQVVGSVIGGLAALLAAFLGLAKPNEAPDAALRPLRIAGFGIACTLGVIFGVWARAHDAFGSSVQSQVQQWKDAGAEQKDAVAFVAYKQLGIVPFGHSVVEVPKSTRESSVLFASHDPSECSTLAKQRFADVQKRADAMKNAGGSWAKIAALAAGESADRQGSLLDAAYQLVCGE